MRRAREAGIHWPLVDELDESTLQKRLYRREVPLSSRPCPNFAHIHAELSHLGVTRLLLWQEYKTAEPDALYYLRTRDGAEVYFVAEYKGRAIPFEVQWTERPMPDLRWMPVNWQREQESSERPLTHVPPSIRGAAHRVLLWHAQIRNP